MSELVSRGMTIDSGEARFGSTHAEFLAVVGQRVRDHRDSVRMSRKVLSQRSEVSERYLAQLESGKGNMSIKLLRKVSIALDVPLDQLVV